MNIVLTGNDRPSLRDLDTHVVMNVADNWRSLGVQLLRPDQENLLGIIATDHPSKVVACCQDVLKKWLNTTEDATWNRLIEALRSPTIQLHHFASQLEQMLSTKCKIYTGIGSTRPWFPNYVLLYIVVGVK